MIQAQSTGVLAVAALLAALTTATIVTPLTGVLVRYRANHEPLVVHLDAEGNQRHSGPRVSGYFGVMRRVNNLEGFTGFYKGFFPTLLSTLLFAIVLILFGYKPGAAGNPSTFVVSQIGVVGSIVFLCVSVIIAVPLQIITNRAIVTPYRLPASPGGITKSLRVLLTPYERQRPWMLYLAPGLLFALALQVALPLCAVTLALLVIGFHNEYKDAPRLAVAALSLFFLAVVVVYCITMVPLQVITVRLTIQRNHAPGENGEGVMTEAEEAERSGLKEIGTKEDVIALRDEMDPYTGLYDCANRITKEEGWRVLFRGWWITLLGQLFS